MALAQGVGNFFWSSAVSKLFWALQAIHLNKQKLQASFYNENIYLVLNLGRTKDVSGPDLAHGPYFAQTCPSPSIKN